ncbi:SIR2 family protein [Klebsiella pneumoniae]|uniref:SIR2 family protein n=1 Tax=Klebsiella pneumoniae TaxID=573 RepID=UPI00272EF035|nr:SIR2 family protein [Klebsiella pneumoniae]EJD6651194.1 SIR2 family protein [Raoultella ornithinolytica]ELV3661866.1 SIR2 family protein [Raoultella ornithinolytica]MDP0689801.1 SIR2 family protein [Klebsiella pneumoniae]MDP0770308.1 SIR2 family protein [Klebsiella pneumoniae]
MKTRPQQHLINILTSTKQHHPNFTLFLGAGASITSGVDSAGGMIRRWREAYASMHGQDELSKQVWYEKDNEYSELFEALYDQPTQRREFIESCITAAKPSWGYVYLTNLLDKGHFNTIFTTNFDDLVNEACFTFSNNLRPIVCAHDSSITSVRLTTVRPKIIKLHGDFLFDNIKNTIRELESLEDNMRAKFRQFATEFGMIVIGYSGHDRSIMDTLNTLLHSGNCFPHGIYWCIRDSDVENLSEPLKNLARFPHFHLITISGFDEFMAELHNALNCELQQEVVEPYSALSNKLDRYFSVSEDDDDDDEQHEIIKRDMNNLADHVRRVNTISQFVKKIKQLLSEKDASLDDISITQSLEIMLKETKFAGSPEGIHFYNTPNYLIANSAFRAGEYQECVEYATKHLSNGKSLETEALILRSQIHLDNDDELQKSLDRLSHYSNLKDGEVTKLTNALVDLMDAKKFFYANALMDFLESRSIPSKHRQLLVINRALCNKLQDQPISSKQLVELEAMLDELVDKREAWLALGAAILLGKYTIAEEVVAFLSESEIVTILTQSMPIFHLISVEFYEKVKALAVERGYDVTFDDEEDAESVDISDNEDSVSEVTVITDKPADNDEAFDSTLVVVDESDPVSKPA